MNDMHHAKRISKINLNSSIILITGFVLLALFALGSVLLIDYFGDAYDYIHLICLGVIFALMFYNKMFRHYPLFSRIFLIILVFTFVDSINRVSGYPDRRYTYLELLSTLAYLVLFISPWISLRYYKSRRQYLVLAVILNCCLLFPVWLLPATLTRNVIGLKALANMHSDEPLLVSKISKSLIWTIAPHETVKVFKVSADDSVSVFFQTVLLDGRGTMEAQGANIPLRSMTRFLVNTIFY